MALAVVVSKTPCLSHRGGERETRVPSDEAQGTNGRFWPSRLPLRASRGRRLGMRQHTSFLFRNILQMILPATPLFQLRDKEGAGEGPKLNYQPVDTQLKIDELADLPFVYIFYLLA